MSTELILLIDNYDSFTYNLVHYIEELGKEVLVFRNDKITIKEIEEMSLVEAIVISPGPGRPKDSGICIELVKNFANKIPILGVCMGHQTIGEVFGANILKLEEPMHGKVSKIYHKGKGIFQGLKNPFLATRYHSLFVEKKSLPDYLEITAETNDGTIMAMQHKTADIHSVQFHPESIASEFGYDLLNNFFKLIKNKEHDSE